MTLRQVAWFTVAYVALVAAAVWFNLAVLCQGDAKYDGGCGGFAVYIPLWEMFLAPLPITAILLERWKKADPPPTGRLVAYLSVILAITEIGFLLIDRFPVLLATQAMVIVLGVLVRSRTIRRRAATGSPVA